MSMWTEEAAKFELAMAKTRIKELEATTVPLSDVVPLLEALQYYTHQPYGAAARATDEFLTKHPEAKPQ